MPGFHIFIEKEISISQLKIVMGELFPNLNFYEWNLQENIIDGEADKELSDKDILIELFHKDGIFKTFAEFYRFPGDELDNPIDLYIGLKLSELFACKTTIDAYSYCDFDQMPNYSLLLENNEAYLIADCYLDESWSANDNPNQFNINIIQGVDISSRLVKYNSDGLKILS